MISSRASKRLLALVVALLAWFGSSTAAPANAEPFKYDAPAVALSDVRAHEGNIAASWQVVSPTAVAAQPASEGWSVAGSLFSGARPAASTTHPPSRAVDPHAVGAAEASPTQIGVAREEPASSSVDGRSTSATHSLRSVATNAESDRRRRGGSSVLSCLHDGYLDDSSR